MTPILLSLWCSLCMCAAPLLGAIMAFRKNKEMRSPHSYALTMLVVGELSLVAFFVLFNHGL